jgi:hypothetical protein
MSTSTSVKIRLKVIVIKTYSQKDGRSSEKLKESVKKTRIKWT